MASQPQAGAPGAGAADAAGARPRGAADAAALPPEGPSPLWLFPVEACGLPLDFVTAVLAEVRGKGYSEGRPGAFSAWYPWRALRLTCRAACADLDARAVRVKLKARAYGSAAQLQASAARFPALRELEVASYPRTWVAAESVGAFMHGLPGLTSVCLQSNHPEPWLLRAIGALPHLRSLDLTECEALESEGSLLAHVLRTARAPSSRCVSGRWESPRAATRCLVWS